MNKSDLRLTILGCFRYSLGRMTYMPGHTVNVIINNADIFNNQDWKRFIEEINDAPSLGANCDEETWNRLKEFSKSKLYDTKERVGERK